MQKLQLSIPEPCHENWQQMTPTEQGRFCNACAKEVIDFSTMTDTQVLNYFTKLTHEKVCGRALPEQLDRMISLPEQPRKRLFWYWNYIVMFFMFFTKGSNANAQTCTKPATEVSPVDNPGIRGQIIAISGKRIITGKVDDKDGNPVSFALIKIKGTNTSINADANGAYSLKVNSKSILVITGASFKDTEVVVGSQTVLNTVMEKDPNYNLKEVVVTMAICTKRRPRPVIEDNKIVKARPVVIFNVKDDSNDLVIENAVVTIARNNDIKSDTAISQKKGYYHFKIIDESSSYLIKVEAVNYQPNEFTIDSDDFKDGKKEWQVLLRKQKSAFGSRIPTRSISQKLSGELQVNVIGQTKINLVNNDSLYIIDGAIITKSQADLVNPDDISDIVRLEKAEATALFGPDGSKGAIVISTRKAKEKTLDTVAISSDFGYKRRVAGGMGYTITYTRSYLTDVKARISTVLTDSLKVYPNPVQRNSTFSVSLKLKEAGNYQVQVTDAAGRIVLQKQMNTVGKNHTETMPTQNWGAGFYHVRIFNKNQLISKAGFIVK